MSGLPSAWRSVQLCDVASARRERADPKARPDDPLIGLEHIEPHTMQLLGTSSGSTVRSSVGTFHPGDVLYGRLRPYLNKVFVPDFSGLCSAEFIVLIPSEGISAEFLARRLNSPDFVAFAGTLDTGDRPRVNFAQISAFEFGLPPTPDQAEIVAILSNHSLRINSGTSDLQKALDGLDLLRASAIQHLVWTNPTPSQSDPMVLSEELGESRRERWQSRVESGRSRGRYKPPIPPDDPPSHPANWPVFSLDQVCEFVTDGDHNPPKRQPSGVPHLTARNIVGGQLDFSDTTFIAPEDFAGVKQRYEPLAGDVIVTCVGTLGRVAVVPSGAIFSPDRNLAGLRALPQVLPEFLALALDTPSLQSQMGSASGSTAQPHLYLNDLRKLAIPLPDLELQRAISEKATNVRNACSHGEAGFRRAIAGAESLGHALTRDTFSGAWHTEAIVRHNNDHAVRSGV